MTSAPRIPLAERVGPAAIEARLFDIEVLIEAVDEQIDAAVREFDALQDRRHVLVSEHQRLVSKLNLLEGET
jgi:hypothetical protein